VLLGSSNSAIVEFIVPEDGSDIMVDHHFANASQGALGPRPAETEIEHHNIPSVKITPTDPETARGQLAFESKCLACHSIGQERSSAPTSPG
jgi:nitrite reductase (NO-forming)